MNILHVSPSFYPATAWGGPIFSTKTICDGIAARPDMALRVLTTDAASPTGPGRVTPVPLPYPVHFARRVAGGSIAPGLFARLPQAIAWADVVHLTATYSFPTLPVLALARIIGRPLVWSPRGALQATQTWDAAPRKAMKRRFETLAQIIRPDATVLHVTAPSEARDSVARLTGIQTACIPNCVTIPALMPQVKTGAARLMYIGRLHPKKGLERLFDAMAALPDRVCLDVYGTGDAAYLAGLQAHAVASAGRIRLHGHVDGFAKTAAFARADLCVFPSYSENFGIVVAEALAHGVPVVTTTATPWAALDSMGCGRCVDLDRVSLAQAITVMLQDDLTAMGAAGRAWMARDFSPDAMTDAFAALYHRLAQGRAAMVPA
ncbi:glycosyltransferase [Yoonia sp.]|uniref:glycosyltransferase n=1 Tax=Yoonia sp. TaxID=2212373 RepID=UPI0019D93380|nr:glycosyltransferase [Yoonia sp.]MBE0412436.1 glycosyltransferase [Yoonia sp.]